jgi:DNA topoisomerase-1
VTAKDFRTWAATTLAAVALESFKAVDTKAALKRNVRRAVEAVAGMLGNTATVCRKCYVHPAILDGYLDGTLRAILRRRAQRQLNENLAALKPEEAAVMSFLHERLAAAGNKPLRTAGGKPRKRTRKAGRRRTG